MLQPVQDLDLGGPRELKLMINLIFVLPGHIEKEGPLRQFCPTLCYVILSRATPVPNSTNLIISGNTC